MPSLPVSVVGRPSQAMAFGSHGYFWRDAALHALQTCLIISSKLSAPFLNQLRHAVDRCALGVATVVHLLKIGCPSAIHWPVTKIILDSIKRIAAMWLGGHVSVKVLKGVAPAQANSDPSSAITWIADLGRVMAAHLHARPNPIKPGAGLPVFRMCVIREASAGARAASAQMLTPDFNSVAAVTLAEPERTPILVFNSVQYNQPRESLTS